MARGKLSAMCAALLLHGVAFGGWAYRSTLTVSGYSGSETLSGFPVLVRLSPQTIPGFAYRDCKVANGGDLRFTSLDGNTVYPHEVDEWNEDGESLVWVKLPSLPSGGTSFYLQYGNPDAPTPADGSAVWSGNAGGNYAGVWHMNEEITPDIAAATASRDSAKRAVALGIELSMDATPLRDYKDTTSESLGEMVSTNGVVGRARVNESSSSSGFCVYNQRLSVPNYNDLNVGSSFSISGWFHSDVTPHSCQILNRKSSWQTGTAFNLQTGNNNDNSFNFSGGDSTSYDVTKLPSIVAGWVHVALVCDGTTLRLYVNGTLEKEVTDAAAVQDNGELLGIGARGTGGYNALVGQYDEVRLLDAVPSADWMAAAYATMTDADFLTATSAVLVETDALDITATEDMTGMIPACGLYRNLADGEILLCSVPDEAESLTETSRRRFAGWSLYRCDVSSGGWTLVDSAETNQLRYVHAGGSPAYRLVWNVVREYRHDVSVSPSGSGTVTAGGNTLSDGYLWAEEGATVTAVPGAGRSFKMWTGTGPWTDESQPSFTLNTTEPLTFSAVFYKTSPSGWLRASKMAVKAIGGEETLVGFPVLVRISPERIKGFDYAMCQAGGADIRFVSPDGSVTYPHEIDEWNTDGESLAWVKLPSLPPEGASFQMLFGNPFAPVQENARAVWSGNAGGNYAGVWHMNEQITSDIAATTASRDSAKRAAALGVELSMDATPLRDYKDTTSESLGEMVSTNGVVGRARVNESSYDEPNYSKWSQCLNVPSYDALGVGGTFAVSGWFHCDIVPRSLELINRRKNDAKDPGFDVCTLNNNAFGVNFGGGTNRVSWSVTTSSIVANWLHVTCVFDDSTYRCYVNGVLMQEVTDASGVLDSGGPMGIGGRGQGGYGGLVGQYDEVRLLDAIPSSNWVAAAYATMTDPEFVTARRARPPAGGLVIMVR